MTQQLRIAHLDDEAVAKIQALEEATNKHIMAFQDGLRFATLSEDEMSQIKALEEELGVILVVYDD